MWNDKDNMLKIFARFENKEEFPCECPNCGKKKVHGYLHRFEDDDKGGGWVWCESCGAYSHVTILIPDWWKNYPHIDEDELVSDPEYLNEFADSIDKHIADLIS